MSAQAAIADLLTRYCDALDEQRFEEWPDFFTEDARYRVTTAENHRKGYPASLIDCMGKPMMRDRLFGLLSANVYEPHAYRHILSQPRVRATGPRAWEVQTSFLLARTMSMQETRLFLAGSYHDRVVADAEDAPPRLAARLVVLDTSLIDLLIVIPI